MKRIEALLKNHKPPDLKLRSQQKISVYGRNVKLCVSSFGSRCCNCAGVFASQLSKSRIKSSSLFVCFIFLILFFCHFILSSKITRKKETIKVVP